jgi:hypothetical protein
MTSKFERALASVRLLQRRIIPTQHTEKIRIGAWMVGGLVLLSFGIWPQPPGLASIILAGWAALVTFIRVEILRKTAAILVIIGLVIVEGHSIYHEHAEFFSRLDGILLNLTGDSYPYAVPVFESTGTLLRVYNDGEYPLINVNLSPFRKFPSEESKIGVNQLREFEQQLVTPAIPGRTYATINVPIHPIISGDDIDTLTIYLATSTKIITEVLQFRKATSQAAYSYRYWAVIGASAPDTPDGDAQNFFRRERDWSDVRVVTNLPNGIGTSPTPPAPPAETPR